MATALSKRGAAALQRAAAAGSRARARVRERERRLVGTGIGLGAGWFGARWVGRRYAEVEQATRETADIEMGPVKAPLYAGGLLLAAAGAMGVTGDDQYDTALQLTGASVFGADMGQRARRAKLDEPAE